jgi:CRISPR/Cas system-associated exonuclease Cas4 (RecB family)
VGGGVKRKQLKNELSYSDSRARTLKECPRKFWYECYVYFGGWWYNGQPPVSTQAEEAYWCRNTMDVHRLVGRLVHDRAAHGLRTALEGRTWTREDLRIELMSTAASKLDKMLKQAVERTGADPKRSTRLMEVETGQGFDEELLRDKVRTRLMGLTSDDSSWSGDLEGTNLYFRAVGKPTKIVSVDEMMKHHVDGVPVNFACDLVMRGTEQSHVVIVDWKTGVSKEDDDLQVQGYAAWAASKGWTTATVLLVYLGQSDVNVVKVDCDLMAAKFNMVERVRSFVNNVKSRLVDQDAEANRPIEDAFEPTADPRPCERCPYQRMCERAGKRPK